MDSQTTGNPSIKAQSAIEYLTTYGWAIIVIAVVLAALFQLGLFSPNSVVSTQCLFPAEFSCLSSILYSTNSSIAVNLQQALPSNINITAVGCNNQGTIQFMQSVSPPATVGIGGNYVFNAICYQNGTTLAISSGQIYRGYLLVNYTQIQTGFPHTVIGTVIEKAV